MQAQFVSFLKYFPASKSRTRRWEVICLILITIPLLLISISRILYPYDVGHYEACIWAPALLTANGHNPYGVAQHPPYIMAPYGYLYYWLIGIGLRLFGYQLWFGRIISFLAIVICLICISRITWRLTQSHEAVLISIVVLLSLFPIQAWIAIQRPDFPALALAFISISLALEIGKDASEKVHRNSIILIFCLVCAVFFKQTVVLPIAITLLKCFQSKRYMLALYIGLSVLSLILLMAWVLNETSSGGYYWQHFTLSRQIPHDYGASVGMMYRILKEPATILFSAILIVHIYFAKSIYCQPSFIQNIKTTSKRVALLANSSEFLIVLYFVLSLTLAFVTSARSGSNVNYYLEALMVSSIVFAVIWAKFNKRNLPKVSYGLLIFLFALASIAQLIRVGRGEYFRWQSLPYYREIVATLEKNISPGTVCISAYPELVIFAGREYHFGDWIQYVDGRSKELEGIFQQAVESKTYPAIIWQDINLPRNYPGYHLLPMENLPPQKYYSVYLFVRDKKKSP